MTRAHRTSAVKAHSRQCVNSNRSRKGLVVWLLTATILAAATQAAPDSGPAVKPAEGADALPVLADGPWAGSYAVYTNALFEAVMDARGWLKVTPRSDARHGGHAFIVRHTCGYRDTTHKSWHGREIKTLSATGAPSLQPQRITLSGKYDDYVRFVVQFDFQTNTIAVSGWREDPPRLAFPSDQRLVIQLAKSHTFADSVAEPERLAALQPFALVLDPLKGPSRTVPYAQRPEHLDEGLVRVTPKGPLFGERSVRFEATKPSASRLRLGLYGGNALWQGYTVYLERGRQEFSDPRDRLLITIE